MSAMKETRVFALCAVLFAALLLPMCVSNNPVPNVSQFPTPSSVWLSRKCPPTMSSCLQSAANDAEVQAYYQTIDPQSKKTTFTNFKLNNKFPIGETKAIYFNNFDLAIGREMHCNQNQTGAGNVACYVTNYGPPPYDAAARAQNPTWPNSAQALSDAVAGHNPFATVAMEFTPPNTVSFYVYDGQGNLLKDAALDGQGPKSVPQMCMACHGGTYSTTTHLPTGSSFLPFDVSKFLYSSQPGFTKQDQQEAFRVLNTIVLATNPNQANSSNPIGTLITTWYRGQVNTAGTIADEQVAPPGWALSANDPDSQDATNLYISMVKPYCQTCHMAARTGLDWMTYTQFKSSLSLIGPDVCRSHVMPHAEIPYVYWQNNVLAQSFFQQYLQKQGSNC